MEKQITTKENKNASMEQELPTMASEKAFNEQKKILLSKQQKEEEQKILLVAVGLVLLGVLIIALVKKGKQTPQIGLPEVLQLIKGI